MFHLFIQVIHIGNDSYYPFPQSKDTIMRHVFFIRWSLASCFIDRGIVSLTREKEWEKEGRKDEKEERWIGKKQEHSFLLSVGFIPYTAESEMVSDRRGQESGKVPRPLFVNRLLRNAPVLYLSKRRPTKLYSEYQLRLTFHWDTLYLQNITWVLKCCSSFYA